MTALLTHRAHTKGAPQTTAVGEQCAASWFDSGLTEARPSRTRCQSRLATTRLPMRNTRSMPRWAWRMWLSYKEATRNPSDGAISKEEAKEAPKALDDLSVNRQNGEQQHEEAYAKRKVPARGAVSHEAGSTPKKRSQPSGAPIVSMMVPKQSVPPLTTNRRRLAASSACFSDDNASRPTRSFSASERAKTVSRRGASSIVERSCSPSSSEAALPCSCGDAS
jgi:hypothetical protein